MHYQLWAEVSLQAIEHNLLQIRKCLAPDVRILASVKANAYGHGMAAAAHRLLAGGADMLGVARWEEGVALRAAGIGQAPVLIFGYTPPEAAGDLLANGLTASVHTLQAARSLAAAVRRQAGKLNVHLKIDTGMGRLGLLPNCFRADDVGDDLSEIRQIVDLPELEVQGIYTHFASADADEKTDAGCQMACFCDLLDRLAARGIVFGLRHAANSAAALEMPETHLNMVRCGLALYGLYPFDAPDRRQIPLQPALAWKARVGLVKEVPAGFRISYGGGFVTGRASRIATVPVGYADGYRRALSNRGQMLVAGCRASVVGRVCMDLTMLDVSHLPEVQVGSEVVILGSQGRETISADEIAGWLGTINYEVVAAIMARVPRVYV